MFILIQNVKVRPRGILEFGSSLREESEAWGEVWPSPLLVGNVGHHIATEIITLSRGLPQPRALILLVLSIFVLLYICKVLSSDLLAVLVLIGPGGKLIFSLLRTQMHREISSHQILLDLGSGR